MLSVLLRMKANLCAPSVQFHFRPLGDAVTKLSGNGSSLLSRSREKAEAPYTNSHVAITLMCNIVCCAGVFGII